MNFSLCVSAVSIVGSLMSIANELSADEIVTPIEYVYQNPIFNGEVIVITSDSAGGNIAFSDMIISSNVSSFDSSEKYAIAYDINMAFYVPSNQVEKLNRWEYRNCAYRVVSKTPWYLNNEAIQKLTILSECSETDLATLYTYSGFFGLEQISLVKVLKSQSKEDKLNLISTYSLVGKVKGFGSVYE